MSLKALFVFLAGVVFLASQSFFTLDETERALKLQLGKIKRSDYEPGLHFKFPFVEGVRKFDARIQTLDSPPELYLTNEKKNVKVDSFVKWRIEDVERYFLSADGNVERASNRLSVDIQKRLRDEFGKRTITQVVSGERAVIMDNLTTSAKLQAKQLGLELVDVRIKRIDLPEEVSESVYERMAAERTEVAKKFRSEGEEAAKRIRAQANRERAVILAEAERDGQKIRGAGDADATARYAEAYSQDAEFYSLYRSLNAYQKTFNNPSDVLLLEPNTQFFRYFNDSSGTGSNGADDKRDSSASSYGSQRQ